MRNRLLVAKDVYMLQEAYDRRTKGVVLERSFRETTFLRVSMTNPVPPWNVPWLVRVECWSGHLYSSQYFGCVEEMIEHG